MKIIVASALSQEAFISKAMNLGADFYMMKPVSFYHFRGILTSFICV